MGRTTATLSKNLLKMKFMKNTSEKEERQAEERKSTLVMEGNLNEEVREEEQKYVIQSSFGPCEDLRFGRISYQGMNPELEQVDKEPEEPARDAQDVDPEEMAERYTKLIGGDGEDEEGGGPSDRKRKRRKYVNRGLDE